MESALVPPAPSSLADPIAMSGVAGGCFIVLEGGEGVGKTTQWRRVADRLAAAGHDVVALREPGGTPAGDALRTVLLDPTSALTPETEALLFAASRAQLVRDVIIPAMHRGAVVLVDRFVLSTYAYQGRGRALSVDALRAVNAFATGGLAPDLTLLLSLPLDESMARMHARGSADRMEREGEAFHRRVRAAFDDALQPVWQAQHPEIGPVIAVDAVGDADVVTGRCLTALATKWPHRFSGRQVERLLPEIGVTHG